MLCSEDTGGGYEHILMGEPYIELVNEAEEMLSDAASSSCCLQPLCLAGEAVVKAHGNKRLVVRALRFIQQD